MNLKKRKHFTSKKEDGFQMSLCVSEKVCYLYVIFKMKIRKRLVRVFDFTCMH